MDFRGKCFFIYRKIQLRNTSVSEVFHRSLGQDSRNIYGTLVHMFDRNFVIVIS